MDLITDIENRVIASTHNKRLVKYCQDVAQAKRRMFRDWTYWGKPVPGFGDPKAELLLIGLAPAAHGANRTGRMFTGDRSGDFLYAALYRAGFANQPTSTDREDGLKLKNCFISAIVRLAPPQNKPTPDEIKKDRPFLREEIHALKNLKAILALGRLAWDGYLDIIKEEGHISSRSPFPFKHGAKVQTHPGGPTLFGCYHPSQQNTQTGVLTPKMMDAVLKSIKIRS